MLYAERAANERAKQRATAENPVAERLDTRERCMGGRDGVELLCLQYH
jgi:hypothetical protein